MKMRNLFSIGLTTTAWFLLLTQLYLRTTWVLSQDFPSSTDAFFYLQEMRHRLSSTGSYYHEASLFFALFEQLAKIFSWNEISSYHAMIGVATGALLSAALLAAGGRHAILLPLAAIPIVFLDTSFFRIYAFPRQALAAGLVLIALALWGRQGSSLRKIASLLLALLAILIHWYALFLAALCSAAWMLITPSRVWVKGVLGLLLAIIFLGVLTLSPFQIANFPLAYTGPAWLAACEYAQCSTRENLEFGIVTVVAAALLLRACVYRTASLIETAALLIVLISNLPLWNSANHLAYRVAFGSMWAAPLLFSSLLIRAKQKLPQLLIIFAALGAALSLTDRKDYQPEDSLASELSSHADLLTRWIPGDAFIQAPHGAQFKVTYFLKRASAPTLPDGGNFSAIYTLSKTSKTHFFRRCLKSSEITAESLPENLSCVLLGETWVFSGPPGRNFR